MRPLLLIGAVSLLLSGCGGDTRADSNSESASATSQGNEGASSEGGSASSGPPRGLVGMLKKCRVPSFELVQTAVSNYGQFSVDDVEYDPAPDPPYRVAPNYATPVNSCGYVDANGSSTMFAFDWTLDQKTIDEWANLDAALQPRDFDLPPHATHAISTDVSTVIVYPGIAFRWSRVAVRDRVEGDATLTADAKAIERDVIKRITACYDDKGC